MKHSSLQVEFSDIMCVGLYLKYPKFLLDVMKLGHSRRAFEKFSNTKFRVNPSRGKRAVTCERTDRQTDNRHNELYINYQLDALIIIYS